MWYVISVIAAYNAVIFLLYGADKSRAERGLWRISENTLIIPAFFLAASGALLGMVVFNHKTSKTKFRALVPLAFLVNLGEFYLLARFLPKALLWLI